MEQLKDYISVSGLTNRQFAVLVGAGYSLGQSSDCDGFFCQRNTFLDSTPTQPSRHLSNVFFNDLLNNQWMEHQVGDRLMYKVRSHLFLGLLLLSLFSFRLGGKIYWCIKLTRFFCLIQNYWLYLKSSPQITQLSWRNLSKPGQFWSLLTCSMDHQEIYVNLYLSMFFFKFYNSHSFVMSTQ